ncbi:MAG: sensor domain-containing diguanylate cyclase [Pseudomonadota bacterium]
MASASHHHGFASVVLSPTGCALAPPWCGTLHSCWQYFGALLVLFTLMQPARAEPPALSLDALPRGPLGQFSHYLQEQPDTPLSLAAVRTAPVNQAFQPSNRAIPSLGIGEPPTWFRLVLLNPHAEARSLQLLIGASWLDQVDVYQVHDQQSLQQWSLGDERRDAQTLIPGGGYAVPLTVSPGRTELFIRVHSADPLLFELSLASPQQQAQADRGRHYLYGGLYGFLLALAAFNLLLFGGMGTRSHLRYAIYLLTFIALNLAYTGHGLSLFWPGEVMLQRYIILLLMLLYGSSGLWFACTFLALDQHATRLKFMLEAAVLSTLALMLALIALDQHVAAVFLAFFFAIAFALMMVLLGIVTIRHGRSVGRYYLLAVTAGAGGAIVTALTVWGWIPATATGFHAVEIGMVAEATMLALALANRMRHHERAQKEAEQLARQDALTGLPNRRGFFEQAAGVWGNVLRRQRPLSVLMIDIDHFKPVNDRYGHDVGDQVLVTVANLLKQNSRVGDIVARWGGEEFLLLLPETALEQASALAERIRMAVAEQASLAAQYEHRLTVSIGCVQHHDEASLTDLIRAADQCLYSAKEQGRNRVVTAPSAVLHPFDAGT